MADLSILQRQFSLFETSGKYSMKNVRQNLKIIDKFGNKSKIWKLKMFDEALFQITKSFTV